VPALFFKIILKVKMLILTKLKIENENFLHLTLLLKPFVKQQFNLNFESSIRSLPLR